MIDTRKRDEEESRKHWLLMIDNLDLSIPGRDEWRIPPSVLDRVSSDSLMRRLISDMHNDFFVTITGRLNPVPDTSATRSAVGFKPMGEVGSSSSAAGECFTSRAVRLLASGRSRESRGLACAIVKGFIIFARRSTRARNDWTQPSSTISLPLPLPWALAFF